MHVRPVTEHDIPLLEQRFPEGTPDKHRMRLRSQKAGRVVYLVASLGDAPAGHGLLIWTPIDAAVASRMRDCAEVTDMFVDPSLRSQGIGSSILAAAEDLANKRGRSWLGLTVGLSNPRARSLYERLGYQDSGLGEFPAQSSWIDNQGERHSWADTTVFLTKALQ